VEILGSNLNIIKIFTIDSLVSSLEFLINYKNYNENDLTNNQNLIYKQSLIDRYVYYVLMIFIMYTLHVFFLLVPVNCIYYALLILIFPNIITYVHDKPFYEKIKASKKKIYLLVITKILSQILEYISKQVIKKDVKLCNNDFVKLLSSEDSMQYILDIIKNIAIISLLLYVKKYSTNFYYKLLKYIFKKKTNNNIQSIPNYGSAKKLLEDIIVNKKWDEFIKPSVYNALFILYTESPDDKQILDKFINYVNMKFIKIITIWSITSIFTINYLPLVLSIVLLLIRFKKNNIHELIYLITLYIPFYYKLSYFDNYIIASIICQVSFILLFNKITFNVLKFITKKLFKKMQIITKKNNQYNTYFLLIVPYLFTYTLNINIYSTILILIHHTYEAMNILSLKKCIIFYTLLLSTITTNYNIFHIIINTLILYVLNAYVENNTLNNIKNQMISLIFNFKFNTKTNDNDNFNNKQIKIGNLDLSLITSYVGHKKKKIFNTDHDTFLRTISDTNNFINKQDINNDSDYSDNYNDSDSPDDSVNDSDDSVNDSINNTDDSNNSTNDYNDYLNNSNNSDINNENQNLTNSVSENLKNITINNIIDDYCVDNVIYKSDVFLKFSKLYELDKSKHNTSF